MRLYDGCPDSELRALMDDAERVDKQLAKLGCRATYFPAEGMWMAFKDLRPITGFHHTKRAAADAAMAHLHHVQTLA